jgi:hypothetical protein
MSAWLVGHCEVVIVTCSMICELFSRSDLCRTL